MRCKLLGFMLLSQPLAACDPSTSDSDPRSEWRGSAPHLAVSGTINGETFEAVLEGAAAAGGVSLYCTREYIAPGTDDALVLDEAVYNETSFWAQLEILGETRIMQFELKEHDLQNAEVGSEITIIPRVESELPAPSEGWFDFEWHDETDEETYEASAISGSVYLTHFDGELGDDGRVIPDGQGSVGLVAKARWSVNEELTISVTAPCGENDIEPEEAE